MEARGQSKPNTPRRRRDAEEDAEKISRSSPRLSPRLRASAVSCSCWRLHGGARAKQTQHTAETPRRGGKRREDLSVFSAPISASPRLCGELFFLETTWRRAGKANPTHRGDAETRRKTQRRSLGLLRAYLRVSAPLR